MPNLSFKEKRSLQKTTTEQKAALRGGQLSFKQKREAQKLLRDALAKLRGEAEETSDFNYNQDAMFTSFFPNNKKAEEVFAEMASVTNGSGKFLNVEAESIIGRLRGAGYSVTKSRQEPVSDDDILNELNHPAAADSPFTPLLSGELSSLAIPDFINRLEAAYSDEEDLDKAKQAAIQYLEANREKLEAA